MEIVNILLSVVCWRISYLLVEEDGPYRIFWKLRYKLKDNPVSPLGCFYCTSLWVAIPLAFFTSNILLNIFVISAVSIFINLIHDRL